MKYVILELISSFARLEPVNFLLNAFVDINL
jgi:hypothetical protein